MTLICTVSANDVSGGCDLCNMDVQLSVPEGKVADHSFVDGPMHVVWARGQVDGYYHHLPNSGLEHAGSFPSIPNYYYKDELKYHGRDVRGINYGHRGFFTVNFFGECDSSTMTFRSVG